MRAKRFLLEEFIRVNGPCYKFEVSRGNRANALTISAYKTLKKYAQGRRVFIERVFSLCSLCVIFLSGGCDVLDEISPALCQIPLHQDHPRIGDKTSAPPKGSQC